MLSNDEIRSKIVDIIADKMVKPKDEITLDKNLMNDLGADSLEMVELSMELEDQFEIRIPEEDAEKIQTVGNAIDYVTKALAAKGSA